MNDTNGGEAAALVLRVRSYRGAPPPMALEARFDGAGGTVGRAPGNLLVLDDPGKYISRLHAAVMVADGRFCLADQGANPSLVNGRPLGAGASAALADGDLVAIGDYLLDVAVLAAAVPEPDAMATMIAAPAQHTAPPPEPPIAPPSLPFLAPPVGQVDALAMAGILRNGDGVSSADPLGLLPDSLAMPVGPAPVGTPGDHVPPERQAYAPPAIPADYDPLASLFVAARRAAAAPPAVPSPAAHAAPPPPTAPAVAPAPVPGPAPAHPVPPAASDAVLRALLDGLGLPQWRAGRPPEETARLAGAMLRAATRGTMEVLTARAVTKRESHIDMTMIAARANNPLKFFPDAETALAQMLGAEAPGYLPAQAAFGAAFDDLKAHELAVIAGMRAALAVVVQRFDPARVEQRLSTGGRLDRLLPARHKARLWDRLVASYGDLVRDADDDLQRLFGEQFAIAYQQQVERLRGGHPPTSPASSHVVE